MRPWYDWQEFNERITILEKKNPKLATDRLQTIFSSILLRRKKDTVGIQIAFVGRVIAADLCDDDRCWTGSG